MSQIGTLLTGAGVTTTINATQMEDSILIGDVDTANPLQGLQVDVDGDTRINIQSAALVGAFAKWTTQIAGTVVGLILKIGSGRVYKNTIYRFVNAGVTTPNIFAWSTADAGIPIEAATVAVNAGSYVDFDKFSALIVTSPANIQAVEYFGQDGVRSPMTVAEMAALFTQSNQAEVDGYLNGCLVIDNRQRKIKSIRLTATGAALSVCVVKFPQEVWDRINGK